MQLKKATRLKSKLRVGVSGPSGSGKTFSSLQMAYGLCGDWEKIALIDTERGSGDLYAHLGPYNTLTLDSPFTPERYMEAINSCEFAGMEVIIIDSVSHEWEGTGGIIETSNNMPGNSFTNWGKLTPRHNKFIDSILQSSAHVICCQRVKQDYVLNEQTKNGRTIQVPEKIGLKAVTREGFDYEMTLAFDIDIKHNANTSKDRTGLFMDAPGFVISTETGEKLKAWVNGGDEIVVPTPIDRTRLKKMKQVMQYQTDHNLTVEKLLEIAKLESVKGSSEDQLEEALMHLCAYFQEVEVRQA